MAAIPTGTPEICLSASVIKSSARSCSSARTARRRSCGRPAAGPSGRGAEGRRLALTGRSSSVDRQRMNLTRRPFQGERVRHAVRLHSAYPGGRSSSPRSSAEPGRPRNAARQSQLADLRRHRRPSGARRAPRRRKQACVEGEDTSTYVLASTDRSDVERLYPSPCGYLK